MNCSNDLGLELTATDILHHGEVLKIIVGLEKGIAGVELHKNAADTPNVAWVAPPKVQNNFGGPIMPGRHDRRVVFVIERGRSKVNQSNLCIQQNPTLGSSPVDGSRRRWYVSIICKTLVVAIYQKYIFRLQVGMYEIKVMKD